MLPGTADGEAADTVAAFDQLKEEHEVKVCKLLATILTQPPYGHSLALALFPIAFAGATCSVES